MPIRVVFFDLGETLVTQGPQWAPGAKALLSSLGQKGYRLGIISNTGNLASRTQILQLLPVGFPLGAFEAELVLFSSEVGVEKPALQIFELAVQRAGVAAGECLFCGENSPETLAAQQVGMVAFRVRPAPQSDVASLDEWLDSQREAAQ